VNDGKRRGRGSLCKDTPALAKLVYLRLEERDRDTLWESYARMVPEALDNLTSEERHQVYKMLWLKVLAYKDGILEVSGVFEDSFALENQYLGVALVKDQV
jgi:hypothetical protein